MNTRQIVAVALLSGFAVYRAALAEKSPASVADIPAKIVATLQKRFPDFKVEQVNPVPQFPGMYEVVMPDQIVYMDANADFAISGAIVDTRTQEDITATRWSKLHAIDFDSLPLDLAIKVVKGDGSRRLAVFADPDCPYCRKLEENIKGLSDVTIYTFLYPLESLHPNARSKATNIWCAKDRAVAWSQWMYDGVIPPPAQCGTDVVAQTLQLSEKLKINSTPTLFLADGSRIDGAISGEQLERRLAADTRRK